MSTSLENAPFGRGETYGTTDSTVGTQYEGRVYEFDDIDWDSTDQVKAHRSNRKVRCMIVRNVASIEVAAKRLVTLKGTAAGLLGQVDGYCDALNERSYPVDEYLSATVDVNDLFYIVIKGPAVVTTATEEALHTQIGDRMVAQTAAASTGTSAGRATPITFTGSSQTTDYTFLEGLATYVGRALTARTTGETNADVLVDVGAW